MELYPFVFEDKNGTLRNSQHFDCFDESSPCVLEQYSACVIKDSASQSKYVPWLICMDTDGENTPDAKKCSEQVGIDFSTVSQCQKTQGVALLQQLLKEDANVDQTPTVFVNKKNISPQTGPDYQTVKAAICADDPSLKGCQDTGLLVV